MFLVGGIGFIFSIISIFNNLNLFYVFITKKTSAGGYLTYLTGLSFCDVIISFFYITIMIAQVSIIKKNYLSKRYTLNISKLNGYSVFGIIIYHMRLLFQILHLQRQPFYSFRPQLNVIFKQLKPHCIFNYF